MPTMTTLALVLFLTACGGGQATDEEIAAADAAKTVQPVNCAQALCK